MLLFDRPGKANTQATLQAARDRTLELGLKQAVVASTSGDTARQAHALLAPWGIQVVVVTTCHGWAHKGWCMSPQAKAELEALGMRVHTGLLALGDDVGTAFSVAGGGRTPAEIVRATLFCFGQGLKVAVECALMAAGAGLLDLSQEAVAIGGTHQGADTAIVCQPAPPRRFHHFRILEILAKPR